ncbi:MAG: BMP family ABC transporter substrate-binding protein [Lachnospiraceae bacterium]|nr:BMP family ABC transporter substrate-binding protein [Lachnospiraceae bacterium]
MKFKKYYKQLTATLVLLLFIIITCLLKFNYIPIRTSTNNPAVSCDIAVITYNSMDSSYTELIKEGIESAAEVLEKTYQIYNTSDYGNSYEDTIKAAAGKSSLVILPDSTFEEAVYTAQTRYVNTYFMLIDGIPHNPDNSDSTFDYNVIPMSYDEAEAGFLAGYAAVYDDYTKLCFICDETSQKSLHYYYGFLQGADYAAVSTGKTNISVFLVQEMNDESFINKIPKDTEIIAGTNEAINRILKDNKLNTIPFINCGSFTADTKSGAVVTKNIKASVNDTILDFYNNKVKGGTVLKFNAANNGISFVFDTNFFKKFDETAYKNIYKLLSAHKISIISDTTVSPDDLELSAITILDNEADPS